MLCIVLLCAFSELPYTLFSLIAEQDGWDDSDWGWQDEEMEVEEEDSSESNIETLSWLQECHISLSPAAELMAIARDTKLVLLSCKSD